METSLFRRFAELCDAVAATTKKSEKVRLVADYLRCLGVEDAARAALFLTARTFPRRDSLAMEVGGALIWQAVAQLAPETEARPETKPRIEALYRQHGDLGDMAAAVLQEAPAGGDLSLEAVAAAFHGIARRRGPTGKVPALVDLLQRAGPREITYLVRILTGELRIGLQESLVEEAIARSYDRPLRDVQRANMMLGDLAEALRLAATDRLREATLHPFHPLAFMLATSAETPAEALDGLSSGGLVEDKYDGVRAQAHKFGSAVKLFARTLSEIREFPELLDFLLPLPGEWVLDGEIVGWRDGRALLFTELQQRLGREHPDLWLSQEVPVVFVAFDLLYQDGVLLLDRPLDERRAGLETLVGQGRREGILLSPARMLRTPEEVDAAFTASLERGNEGLMVKDPTSGYTPGRRGKAWRKLKRPMATLDVVVTAVEYGHGKRKGLLSDYIFAVRDGDRLVTIGRAYSGLTDAEIRRLTDYFLTHTIADEGIRRLVEPTVVLEVAFNNIQRSNRHESGYALRFPRIVRLRPDKPPSEIDTLDRVREVYERQGKGAGQGHN